jgi:hypothetical protein
MGRHHCSITPLSTAMPTGRGHKLPTWQCFVYENHAWEFDICSKPATLSSAHASAPLRPYLSTSPSSTRRPSNTRRSSSASMAERRERRFS